MENKIFLTDLAEGLARRKSVSKKDAESFVRMVFDTIQEQLLAGESVKIKGLGTFKVITVGSRESVNVSTGERFTIDSHGKISFTPDKTLSDHVNRPFVDFETVVLNDETKTTDMERIDEPVEDVEEPTNVADEPVAVPEEVAEPVSEEPAAIVEEPAVIEEPAAVVEEPAVVEKPAAFAEMPVEEAQPVEVEQPVEEPQPDESKANEAQKQPDEPKKSKWWLYLLLLVILLVLAWAIFGRNLTCAHYQDTVPATPATEQVEEPAAQEPAAQEPAAAQESAAAEEPAAVEEPAPVKNPEELAAEYPQIENGEYWIVGVKTVHVMQAGEDLSILAEKYYQDKRLISYIYRLNHYTNWKADHMLVGDKVKIPELVKK